MLINLKESVELLEKTAVKYTDTLKKKEKDLIDFENKYNLRPNREGMS